MDARQKHQKRRRLYRQQNGRCYYCGCQMRIHKGPENGIVPKTFATFEHLDDRYTPDRGKVRGQRIVLACHGCNHNRAKQRTSELTIEERRERSGRHSFRWVDDGTGSKMAVPLDNRRYSVRLWLESEHAYYEAIESHLLGMGAWLDNRGDVPDWAHFAQVQAYVFGDDVTFEGMQALALQFADLCEELGLVFSKPDTFFAGGGG